MPGVFEGRQGVYTGRGGVYARSYQQIDSFEDGSLSEYTISVGNFDAFLTDRARHGDYVARFSGNLGVGNNDSIQSTAGLPRYPSRGDDFGVWVWKNGPHNAFMHFGVQETRNKFPWSYSVRVYRNTETFELWFEKPEAGVTRRLDKSQFDTTNWANSYSEFRISWGSPTIAATVHDANGQIRGRVSADDTRLDGGGVGFAAESGSSSADFTSVMFDDAYMV